MQPFVPARTSFIDPSIAILDASVRRFIVRASSVVDIITLGFTSVDP
jgi:hypothetical protein